jgi:hypothetical protein
MFFLLSGLCGRPAENWPQIQTKVASKAGFAAEASFCAAWKDARSGDKSLKQRQFGLHDPET